MDERVRKLAFWETVGSVIWFMMDGFWMRGWATLAIASIVPSAATNLMAFRYSERKFAPMAITAAMNAWLAMNCFWMVADLHHFPMMAAAGDACFALGVILILLSCARTLSEGGSLLEVVGRFRRFRVRPGAERLNG